MYNAELKERFINQYSKSEYNRERVIKTFDAVERFELNSSSDICTMSKEMATAALEKVAGIRSNVKSYRVAILRSYVRWCIDNNIPGSCDGLLQVKIVGLDTIRHRMVANPKMLEKRLETIFDTGKSEYEIKHGYDNIYKAFYWMAFMGIPEEQIVEITADEIRYDLMMITHNGLNYQICVEALPVLRACANEQQFLYIHANYTSNLRDRVDGNILLRGFNGVTSVLALRSSLSRITKKRQEDGISKDIRLSYVRVRLSGIFYRKYQDEIAGESISFRQEAQELVYSKEEHGDLTGKPLEARIRKAERDYYNDYNRWKLAFSLA